MATRKPSRRQGKQQGDADARWTPLVAAFARDRRVTHGGRGFGAGALKVDGRIFAMIDSAGDFVVKLPKARVDALVAAGAGARFDPGHGRVMKEWIALSRPPREWLDFAREARRFVGGAR